MTSGCKSYWLQSEFAGSILRRLAMAFFYTVPLFSIAFFLHSTLFPATFPSQFPSIHSPVTSVRPAPTNLSHLIFAIGGSVKTWNRRQGFCDLWWRPGKMRGHVWLDTAPSNWSDTCPPWRVSSTPATKPAARMARIAAEAYELGLEQARWFVMGDDDTVFFPENLAAVLGKYDHEQMYYVGASSESAGQAEHHSYGMAFGGGGFAVSHPAAAALAGAIDGCLARYAGLYGSDQRVHACFAELGVPLTREPGFHQVDLKGDIYGMLAAHPVAPLLSLHHLNTVQAISPLFDSQLEAVRSLAVAARADPPRTLQQCFCYPLEREHNWSLSVSWGYTAQLYPRNLLPRELEVPLRTFKTWRGSKNGPFTFNTREVAPPDRPCEWPFRFFLEAVGEAENGTVTEYKQHVWGDEGDEKCSLPEFSSAARVQRVSVRAPKMDPTVWRKAPRRQCCEAARRDEESIQVNIRNCRPGEVALPLQLALDDGGIKDLKTFYKNDFNVDNKKC